MELNKREQTAHLIEMSDMKKRHEKLRSLVGFVKQRINELKFTADSKLEEARALSTSIEGRSLEVEAKLRAVDAKLAEVSKKTSEIVRKSSEIEAKESSLMRERMSFYNERDAHERSLSNQREDLREWERKLQEGEEKLAEVRQLLNQREELVNDGDRVFKQKQLLLEEAQKRIDVANLELKSKEDDISTRMENLALKEKEAAVFSKNLEVREKELLELEEKLNARQQVENELSETQELLKREQTAHLIAMSEVKKQEEKLRTALGVEKQRVNELEIAVREMRSEHAEINSKLEEAHTLSTSIEGRSLEVEPKLHAVGAELAEVSRKTSEIIRKSSEIVAKESSLMRERMSFYNERDAHERILSNQWEDLRECERKLQEGEEKLAEIRRLLNQREELVSDGDRVFKQKQLVLEEAQKRIDVANLELKSKEDDISTRMENLALKEKEAAVISKNLEVREKELLELEEKLKPKEQHEMMQTTQTTNWFDLPLVLQVDILRRVVAIEKLWNLPKVCRDWRKICEEPSMWSVIYMDSYQCSDCWPYPWPSGLRVSDITYRKLCKNAVDRSQGQLVDITMVGLCDDELLDYVADRSPKLRILEIAYGELYYLSEALKKLPKLEELSIYCADRLQVDQAMGSYCQELKRLRLNACSAIGDKEIVSICENLLELKHLELHKNYLSNTGLQAILDGCPSLEVLDLRLCLFVDLKGISAKRLEQIGCVLHAEPVDTEPYNPSHESLMDVKTWRKIIVEGKLGASMSDSDSD